MPRRAASAGACIDDRRAVDANLARVGAMDAGQDLHQRRLAGAVLADERRRSRRPETSKSTRSSATTPGKRLEIADICSKGTGIHGDSGPRRGNSDGTRSGRSGWSSRRIDRIGRGRANAPTVSPTPAPAYVESCYFCPRNLRVERRAQSRLPVGVRLRQRPSLRRRRRAARARSAARHLSERAGHRRGARGLLHAEAQHDARGAAGRRDRRAARHLARSVPRARRAARGPPRADVREQGRGRRRVEPASARADLRDELRLQDDRDRGRRQPALLPGARPRAVSGHHPRRAGRRPPDSLRELVGDRRSSRTSRATPTSATSRRRRRTPAWRRCRRASCDELAAALKSLLVRYDNLWRMSFPVRADAAPGADRRRRPLRLPLPHRVPPAAAQAATC